MNETPYVPKPYVVEHWNHHMKRWRYVACFETEAAAGQELGKVGLHRLDRARVRDLNTGQIIGERAGTI